VTPAAVDIDEAQLDKLKEDIEMERAALNDLVRVRMCGQHVDKQLWRVAGENIFGCDTLLTGSIPLRSEVFVIVHPLWVH
jgi:hypothetical protein